jgi:hypothetical protein
MLGAPAGEIVIDATLQRWPDDRRMPALNCGDNSAVVRDNFEVRIF